MTTTIVGLEQMLDGLRVDFTQADFIAAARHAAQIYAERGSVFVELEPGDATRYPILLTNLEATAGLRANRTGQQQIRPQIGGELAVQVFEHPTDGRTVALGMPCYLLPPDVAEYLGVTNPHTATVLAVFLTAFSAMLDDLRGGG